MPLRFLAVLKSGSQKTGEWLGSLFIVVLTVAVLFSVCGFVVVLARKVGMSDTEAGSCLIGGCLLVLAIQRSDS